MKFDWTLSIGNIVTAAVLLVGFYAAHQQNIRKLQDIETKVALMFHWFQNRIINERERRHESD